jgi:hypothetical protein
VRAFDAELYLRLLGERMLTDRVSDHQRGPRRPTIAEAALALIAVNAIDAPRAEQVIDDYSFAATVRGDDALFRRSGLAAVRPRGQGESKPLAPRRVVPCPRTIEQAQATVEVRYVSLSADSTSAGVTCHPASIGGGPLSATLADDRGATVDAHFSGGGSHLGMRGLMITDRPLAPDTAWIELDGTRLELTAQASRFQATLERLPDQDPAHRYLWHRMAEPSEFSDHGIEPAVEALVAAGALSARDPLIDDMRTVLQAMQGRVAIPGAMPSPGPRISEPWRSLVARHGRDDGPRGTIVLGAVPPVFDGQSVAVLDVESEKSRFRVDVETAPGVVRTPSDWGMAIQPLAWWARDDCGNHYLGQRGQWSYRDEYGHGVIDFHPALDPQATRLELLPTGQTTRAVISFPLAWSAS